MHDMLQHWPPLLRQAGIPAAAALIALAAHWVIFRMLNRLSKKTAVTFDEYLVKRFRQPLRWLMILAALRLSLDVIEMSPEAYALLLRTAGFLFIGLVAWLLINAARLLDDYVTSRFDLDTSDNLKARKIHTQLTILKRIAIALVVTVAICLALMTFENVRRLGSTLLASVGIIGIIVGLAAQKTIGTFIAGIQLAFTQPIRVDDVVIVENEWGRIEEITLTYVVVKIWDLRRLILPATYFLEKPFQNWTRTTADLLGTVYVYADYTIPVEPIRQELERILQDSGIWDGKVCGLQVTGASERTVELRGLVSAPDASAAWNLRCLVREKLVEFIRTEYPGSLPRVRAAFETTETGAPRTADANPSPPAETEHEKKEQA